MVFRVVSGEKGDRGKKEERRVRECEMKREVGNVKVKKF